MVRNILLLLIILLLSGCTVSHTYGPFMGKVVDKESGEPIEGAVVYMLFVKHTPSPGGSSTSYGVELEVLTDSDGEFVVPSKTIWHLGFLDSWDRYGYIMIFKPGYGYYPRENSEPLLTPDSTFPPNEHIVVKLPKLKTRKERRLNLRNAPFTVSDTMKKYFELLNQELQFLGLPLY